MSTAIVIDIHVSMIKLVQRQRKSKNAKKIRIIYSIIRKIFSRILQTIFASIERHLSKHQNILEIIPNPVRSFFSEIFRSKLINANFSQLSCLNTSDIYIS